MQTIYSVLSKGKELECSFTTRLQADAFICFAKLSLLNVEAELCSDAEFAALEQQEIEHAQQCEQWGESTDLEMYQHLLTVREE